MTFIDKYRYIIYTLHTDYEKLNNIFSLCYNNTNILIHGPKNSGKYNFLMNYFKNILHYDIKLITNTIKINDTEIEYESNKYFFVINPYLYGYNDKTVITTLVKEISSTKEIYNQSKKTIIIKNVDKLSREAISSLRVIIEKNYKTCLFILLSNNISKINGPITSRCTLIRLSEVSDESIDKLCDYIISHEKIKIPQKSIKEIKNSNRNITNICILLEYYSLFKKNNKILNYEEYWAHKIIEDIISASKKDNLDTVNNIRDTISHIIHNNIDINDILLSILHYFIHHEKIHEIIEIISQYQYNYIKGNREYLHIEAIFINIIYSISF
jgi:DNA polymerase III delta prime subunit